MKPGLYIAVAVLFFILITTYNASCQSFIELDRATPNTNHIQTDTNQVLLLLKSSKDLIMKSDVTKAEVDSSERMMKQGGHLAYKLNYLRGQGNELLIYALILRQRKRNDQSFKTALQAIKVFAKINDFAGQADGFNIIGDGLSNNDDQIVKRISYFQKAIHMLFKSGQKERAAILLTYLGDLEIWSSRYDDALKDLNHSLIIFKSIGYKKLQATYDLIAYDYLHLGNINEALKYNLLAVQTAETNGESGTLLSTIYNRAGLTYSFADNWQKAVEYQKKALHQAYKMKDSVGIVQISLNLGGSMLKSKNAAEAIPIINSVKSFKVFQEDNSGKARVATLLLRAYIQKKDYKSAEIYFKEVKQFIALKDIEQNVYVKLFSGIIAYYQATNQFEKTYPFIAAHIKYRTTLKVSVPIDDNDDLNLFKADSAAGKMFSAVRHLQRYMFLSDSLMSEKNRKQASLLEIQFEADKKDRDIRFKTKNIKLLTRQTQLQKISFRQERIIRNWIIAASGLLLLVIAILYNRFRLKKRNNRFLEAQHLSLQVQQEEINKKNEDLVYLSEKQSTLLKEKEWLLREIHHRVKNNLQITMSLLNIQSSYLETGFALDAIVNSQRRMQAMSLIHIKLYQSDNLAYIDMSSYIPELVGYLKDSFSDGDFIIFELHTPSFQLDISQAVPVGLILNEAITNAIKYAFQGRNTGRIKIVMQQDNNEVYILKIIDDGIGMPDNKGDKKKSFGMNLMRGLTQQIQGDFCIENKNGTTVTICFKDVKLMIEELSKK
ncbi:tetratricopeptide repeat-containing sensor histidine kinase [Mucilaginibacter phyllosphaerae]